MINQQALEGIARQSFAFGVTGGAAIRPAPVEAAITRNPKRAIAVFSETCDRLPVAGFVWHGQVNRRETKPPATLVQSVETFICSAPECAIVPFEQNGDRLRVPVLVSRNNHRKHWQRGR